MKAARGHSNARRSLPRFCHESNRTDLIEADAGEVRTRRITRFQLTSITNGAISNPSVSAAKSLVSDGLGLRNHYPRGSFVVLDAAGHNVHLEQPEVTAALVRDWLARIDREPLPTANPT